MLVWLELVGVGGRYRRIGSVVGRILPGLLCPRGIARCAHCRQRCLRSLAMRVRRRAVYRTVDVVLKDGGFVDSRKVAIINEPLFHMHLPSNIPSRKDVQQRCFSRSTITPKSDQRNALPSLIVCYAQQHQLSLHSFRSSTKSRHSDKCDSSRSYAVVCRRRGKKGKTVVVFRVA